MFKVGDIVTASKDNISADLYVGREYRILEIKETMNGKYETGYRVRDIKGNRTRGFLYAYRFKAIKESNLNLI